MLVLLVASCLLLAAGLVGLGMEPVAAALIAATAGGALYLFVRHPR
jgi:hypothetical protein